MFGRAANLILQRGKTTPLGGRSVPKLTRKPPAYTPHKASGQARARFEGRDHYLGPYGSRESREAYARLIAQLARDEPTPEGPTSGLSVGELILKFWAHCQV